MTQSIPSSELRSIERRIRARQHGPITRLISPEGLGDQLKPFIFLDYFSAEIEPGFGFGMHPHSGIATLTWQPGTDVRYRDTTGKNGILEAGGLEWMNAGGGAWHEAELLGSGKVTGFQLWVPLPPGVENGPSLGQYVPPSEVPVLRFDQATVSLFLGCLSDGRETYASSINAHHDMNYFAVTLESGGSWRYAPPAGHDVAFALSFEGSPLIQGEPSTGELLVLGPEGQIEFEAPNGQARVVIGTAKKYAEPLVLGPSSVHSSQNALALGLTRIQQLGDQIQSVSR